MPAASEPTRPRCGRIRPKAETAGEWNLEISNPRPTTTGRDLPQSALGCRLSRRLPGRKRLAHLLFNSCCYAPTPPSHFLRVVSRHSCQSYLRFHSRVIAHPVRPVSNRCRLHLEGCSTTAASLPTHSSPAASSDSQNIPLQPLLRHCGFILTATPRLAAFSLNWNRKVDSSDCFGGDVSPPRLLRAPLPTLPGLSPEPLTVTTWKPLGTAMVRSSAPAAAALSSADHARVGAA